MKGFRAEFKAGRIPKNNMMKIFIFLYDLKSQIRNILMIVSNISFLTNYRREELAEDISVVESDGQLEYDVGKVGDYECESVGKT